MTLAELEKTALIDVASSILETSKTSAICLYGSKAAGYARPDSDYDLIIVAKKFREGIRYRYVEEPLATSALVVDEELLHRDARTSYLGEFVIGRFLNVYEPLSNGDLFRSVELEYKKRMMVEALLALSSDYGDFSNHFLIPYEYFLFDKLKKRAVVYPPALYSYTMTYGGPKAAENLAATVGGFRAAAESLSSRGLLRADQGGVRIIPERLKGDAFTKVQSLFALTTRGVTQYAVHGYAGRVGLSVFRREAQSKLKRMRENNPPPHGLLRPQSLLRLEEGLVIADASRLEKELGHLLGFDQYIATESDIGEPYSTTRVLTFKGAGMEASVVIKNFTDVRSLKWALLGVWAAAANRFSMSPLARLEREYAMTLRLRSSGVRVPSIVAVAPDERIIVKEFVKGPTLARVIEGLLRGETHGLGEVARYGELIARIHQGGLALGDAKASNVVVAPEGLVLTDLEQALPQGDRAWDIAEFLYYSGKLSTKEDLMRTVAETFLQSYVMSGERETVTKASGSKYFRPFQPILSPGMAKMLRDRIAAYA